MIDEFVCISLDKYHKFLENEKILNKLDKQIIFIEKELEQIISDPNFNLNIGKDKKIYKIYERIILNE